MTTMDIPAIAQEIAASIMAVCVPGTIPSHTLLVGEFTNAYELFDISPCERDHQQIADLVGELMNKRR
jgi:hypothetical protein